MERDTYLVLRVTGASVAGPDTPGDTAWRSGEVLGGALEVEYQVETQALDPKESGELRRDPQVRAIARPLPLRLIEPIPASEAPAAPEQSADATWGVLVTGALESPYTGRGVTVAVLDTGIDAGHEAFAGVELVQQDFTGEGDGDQDGHGTHVAGTIFGQEAQGMRIGVAPGVRRALIGKVLGVERSATTAELVRAIQWAVDGGAHIINMSLGIDFPRLVQILVEQGLPVDLATSQALAEYRDNVRFFDRAAALWRVPSAQLPSALIVAAAGNESKRSVHPSYTIDVSLPAATDGVVSVAALQSAGPPHDLLTVAPFSNVRANVAGPGVGVVSAQAGGGYVAFSGTSMASPHVAGVAALWAERQLQLDGVMSVNALASRLVGTASLDRLGDARPNDVGEGLVVAPRS
ncbi:MAG TPA: S8 family serine peptidase [Chloroflexaceae bacterium]|nr:S8 family serine peptidase [Chloroflexaceae bacterium]